MKQRKLFLRWAVLMSLLAVGCGVAANLGLFGAMLEADATKLTVATITVFALYACWAGILAWRIDGIRESVPDPEARGAALKEIDIGTDDLPHARELCEILGFMGTVIGLIMMLSGFGNLENLEAGAVRGLLGQLVYSMSTAFVTTLVGYVCSILLRLMHREMMREVERLRP